MALPLITDQRSSDIANGPFSNDKQGLVESRRENVAFRHAGDNHTRNPRIGCAGIVRRGEQILLGRRDKEPARGLWVLPGGGVDFGETFAETLQREVSEEVGIEIDVEGVFKVCELINPPNEHRVIVYLNARYRSGQPVASSDLSDARFFDTDELKRMSVSKMISPFVESVLRNAQVL